MCKKQSRRSLHPQISQLPGRNKIQLRLTEINDKLEYLQTGNPFFPPNTDATGTLEVVPVHDNMYQQVEDDRHP